MALQLMLPDHMEPLILKRALMNLDSELEIRIGYETKDSKQVEYVVVWNHPHGKLRVFENLKTICVYGHGVDSVLLDPGLPDGVSIVRITDETMAVWMSEYLLTVVLMHRRDLLTNIREPGNIHWGRTVRRPGNRVGILGMGYLGRHAAGLFKRNGFDVTGWSRTPKTFVGIQMYSSTGGLPKVLATSDYLICLLPLTKKTEGLLCHQNLRQMKIGAYLINVGRGHHLVDEDLISILDEGHLSGACLDVFREEPLPKNHHFHSHGKILVTPHNSSSTPAESVAPQILENYRRMKSGAELLNQVDIRLGY